MIQDYGRLNEGFTLLVRGRPGVPCNLRSWPAQSLLEQVPRWGKKKTTAIGKGLSKPWQQREGKGGPRSSQKDAVVFLIHTVRKGAISLKSRRTMWCKMSDRKALQSQQECEESQFLKVRSTKQVHPPPSISKWVKTNRKWDKKERAAWARITEHQKTHVRSAIKSTTLELRARLEQYRSVSQNRLARHN